MDLRTMYVNDGPFAWLAAMLLLLLSVVWLATVIARVWTHVRMRRRSRRFVIAAEALLNTGRWADVVDLAQSKAVRRSPIASVVGAGLETWLSHRGRGTDALFAWQIARASMSRSGDEQVAAARRGSRTLLVIGVTAPLVGLLGGIFGLYSALWALSITGPGGLAAISAGIGQALVVPACGLLVSLLALWAWAWLTRSVESLRLEIGRTTFNVLDRIARSPAPDGA